MRDHVPHPYKTTGTIMVLYILTFIFLDRRWDDNELIINNNNNNPWRYSSDEPWAG
jgi:hypothetical protein